jgi:hypothetical protein
VKPLKAVPRILGAALCISLLTPLAPFSGGVAEAGCLRYVAAGDHIPAGHEVSQDERFPSQLAKDHLFGATENDPSGWCVYNVAKNDTTSATYNSGGQLAETWNYFPDLITLTVGEENTTVVNLVTSCFDKIKDHDFAGGNACASQVLANTTLWTDLTKDLTTTLQQYHMIMAGRPQLVVAVTGYPNPYPKALDAAAKVATLCPPLQDTIPTCTARWVQLSPALQVIDQTFVKLNDTIKNALGPFQAGPSGNRFVYVDTYTKTRDHCMKMEVEIKTRVYHPPNTVHQHNSPTAVNFGCSDPWYVAGSDGTAKPNYLVPAATGILLDWSQTTKGMGIHPNQKGHKCIADLVWEADTIDPGTTPLKWLLGYGEASKTDICQ